MAKINFGGVEENVVTREEFPLEKALETLKDETIAVIGYGVLWAEPPDMCRRRCTISAPFIRWEKSAIWRNGMMNILRRVIAR